MSAHVVLRAVPAEPHPSDAHLSSLDDAVGQLLVDFAGVELSRDARGALLVFADALAAGRFALALRAAVAIPDPPGVAIAIETGIDRLDVPPGRAPRAFGPGPADVDALIELALPGQVLVGEGVAERLAEDVSLVVEPLGAVVLGTAEKRLFELAPRTSGVFPPRRRGAFVGREAELDALLRLLDAGQTLVSLVGAPGAGKSRLALEALAARQGTMRAAVASVRDATDTAALARIVASALGVPVVDAEPAALLERVHARLSSAVDLLVLDGLPSHTTAESGIAAISSSRGVRVIVTATKPLGLAEEMVVEVPPLARPQAETLFERRCREAGNVAWLGDRPSVTRLVAQLGGLPLAIEIAAARMGEQPPRAVLEDLEKADAGSVSRALDRHLESAIAASYRALEPDDARLLGLIALLPMGLAAQCVSGLARHAFADAPEAVQRLARRAMLVEDRDPTGELRLVVPGCVRRHVAASIATEAKRDLSTVGADVILEQAERWSADARGAHPAPALRRLAIEQANLSFLHDALGNAAPHVAVRCALVLHTLLWARGPRALHLDLLASATDIAERAGLPVANEVRLARAAALATVYGDAEAASEEAARIPVATLTAAQRGTLRWVEGLAHFAAARHENARAAYADALVVARTLDDPVGEARAANGLGNVYAHLGQMDEAERAYRDALSCHARTGDRRSEAVVLQNLARLARERGRTDTAAELSDEAIALAQDLGDARVEGMAWAHGGLAAHDRGDLPRAKARYGEAVARFDSAGEWRFRGWTLAHAALAWLEEGDLRRADELLAQASARDPVTEGLLVAVRGAANALEGRAPDDAFERARALVTGDPMFTAAVDVLAALEDARRAAEARAEGRDADAVAANSDARARWASASSSIDGGPSRASQSSLVRIAGRLLGRTLGDTTPALPARVLEVGPDATWFQAPHAPRTDLSRRSSLRRIVATLAERRTTTPSTAVTAAELIDAAWPGEWIERSAARNRLYVAIAFLRKAGLGEVLLTRSDGYMIDPNVGLVVRPSSGALAHPARNDQR